MIVVISVLVYVFLERNIRVKPCFILKFTYLPTTLLFISLIPMPSKHLPLGVARVVLRVC